MGRITRDCGALQKLLRRQCRGLAKHPFDKQRRHAYIKTRNEYKRACRGSEKRCRHELTKKLLNVGLSDPKGFWNIIKKMNDWGKEKEDETDQIKPSVWKEYFTGLLNGAGGDTGAVLNDATIPDFIPTFEPILDRQISMTALRKALSC